MTDSIQWTEPGELTERKLQDVTLPWLRKTFRKCTLYWLLAVAVLIPLCYFANGLGFSILAFATLTLLIYQVPFLIWLNIRQGRKFGVKYEVSPKGLRVNRRFHFWRDVQAYDLGTSALTPEVGILSVKVRHRKDQLILSFQQRDVNEKDLRTLLLRFGPQIAPPT